MENVSGSRKWYYISVGLAAILVLSASVGFTMKATDQRTFCGSCHAMAEAAWTHRMSVHSKIACNECHAPRNMASKAVFKAVAGTRDIYAFTIGEMAQTIHATENTKEVVNENCRSCHTATTMNVAMDAKRYCTDCHRNVPHFKKIPIDLRSAADE